MPRGDTGLLVEPQLEPQPDTGLGHRLQRREGCNARTLKVDVRLREYVFESEFDQGVDVRRQLQAGFDEGIDSRDGWPVRALGEARGR